MIDDILSPVDQLKASTVSIYDFFESSFIAIPKNQREYRWEKKHREKLWEDLIVTKDDKDKDPKNSQGHFLGAVVIISKEDEGRRQKPWRVIDGQQRLTTISILASCMKEFLLPIIDSDSFEELEAYLNDLFKKIQHPRIRLNRKHDFYEQNLIHLSSHEERLKFWISNDLVNTSGKFTNGVTEVEKNIINAFTEFNSYLNVFFWCLRDDLKIYEEQFRKLLKALLSRFYILLVRVTTDDLAYQVFETLNQRGLKLSQADLIKNSLFDQSNRLDSPQTVKKVEDTWENFLNTYDEQPLNKLDLTQFIQFSYSSRHELLKKDDSFVTIDKTLSDEKLKPIEFAEHIASDAELWNLFLQGDDTVWLRIKSIGESQQAIIDPLWKAHCAPLIMTIMRLYKNDPTNLAKSLEYVETFLFREGLINSVSASHLQKFFSEAAIDLEKNKDLIRLREMFSSFGVDSEFLENFAIAKVNNKQGFYIFRKIEMYLQGGNKELDNIPAAQSVYNHLEHIMPKKPDSDWNGIEHNPDFLNYLGRIGNLLILKAKINQSIKNRALSFKLESSSGSSYQDSEFEVTKKFLADLDGQLDGGEWTFKSIQSRQSQLANEYALEVWSYKG